MVTLNSLQEAPSLGDFVRNVRQEEDSLRYYEIPGYCLKLYDDGKLGIDAKNLSGRFILSKKALGNLAKIAGVYWPFFLNNCDNKLRSIILDYLLPQKVSLEERLSIVLRDGEVVHSIQNNKLLFARRAPILDTVSNAKPENISKEDLKVIEYEWNDSFDISVIAPALRCHPKKDDTVAFGINVAQGRDGSVQVQGAAFRLECCNGAVNRICDSRQHRLRRPTNRPDGQRQFLNRISVFAEEAWSQWSHQIEELERLTKVALDQDYVTALRPRLRQAPFFLSLRVVNQILERLRLEIDQQEGGATLYDLWNAMSYMGTHQRNLSNTYRTRLRYGAGEFTRHRSRVCKACRQLLLS